MRLIRRHLLALAFEPDPAPLPLRETAALLLFHLIALGLVCRLAHWPYLAALLFIGLIAGTYSSIFLCAPLLVVFQKKSSR